MNLSSATFEFGRITQNNGHYAAAITPFKFINVTDFGNNRKLMCDFLHVLVINTNLHPISHHRFCVTADYWSNLRFRQGVPFFNSSFGVNP